MTVVVTADRIEERFISVKPRIHWVNLNSLKVLDVLPRGFEEVEADHVVVGLHSGGDGVEQGVLIGKGSGGKVYRLMRKRLAHSETRLMLRNSP